MTENHRDDESPEQNLQIDEHELRRKLQIAFDRMDRGELEEWDVEEFLRRMNGRLT